MEKNKQVKNSFIYENEKIIEVGKLKKCCLCNKEFNEFGNNPEPLSKGICCDECNTKKVIPSRLKQLIQ